MDSLIIRLKIDSAVVRHLNGDITCKEIILFGKTIEEDADGKFESWREFNFPVPWATKVGHLPALNGKVMEMSLKVLTK